jgi:hypothetical protein
MVTAGLIPPPEILSVAEIAIASPCPFASAVTMRLWLDPDAATYAKATAEPAPTKTNRKVPTNSAIAF